MSKAAKNDAQAQANLLDPRWASIVARDSSADRGFYYAVRTTGVYCRPSCGARLARPENVVFFSSCEDAELAGFRPCKRCKPNQATRAEQNAEKIEKACRIIENSEGVPSLSALAKCAGMSPFYFHRQFKAATGLTPGQYASAQRDHRIRQRLPHSASVTEAIYDAGFNSNSRFYERSNEVLGMTPTSFREGGKGTDIRFAIAESSLGSILAAQSEKGVCAILIGDDPKALVRDLQDRFPKANLIGHAPGYEKVMSAVVNLVENPRLTLDLPLDIRGTAFQQRVWKALQQIPVGSTATYTDIARKIGAPKSFRAVAQACGANQLAVVIPCHRVIRNDGSLSGYRWGVERKRSLLSYEAHKG